LAELTFGPLKAKYYIHDTIPLKFDIGADDVIYGIRSQMVESVYNILDNAYEACLEKKSFLSDSKEKEAFKPLICLKLLQESDKSIIEISDNGIGIKDDCVSKIFAPFFTTKSSYKCGTGIGLYVVRRIVEENHHGRITFQSKYLQGTKFILELPKK